MTKTTTARAAVGAVVAWVVWSGAAGAADDYRVIVNSANPVTSLRQREVSALFLRRSTRWDDGTPALPVDGPD